MGMTPSAIIWGTDSSQELACGLVASMLMAIGTIATYMVQSKQTGAWGFGTALAISFGNIATICMLWAVMQSVDPKADNVALDILHVLLLVGLTGGSLAFTILSYRANVFPRWVVVLMVLMLVAMVLPIEDNKYFALFWGLSYAGMGYTIWSGKLNTPT